MAAEDPCLTAERVFEHVMADVASKYVGISVGGTVMVLEAFRRVLKKTIEEGPLSKKDKVETGRMLNPIERFALSGLLLAADSLSRGKVGYASPSESGEQPETFPECSLEDLIRACNAFLRRLEKISRKHGGGIPLSRFIRSRRP